MGLRVRSRGVGVGWVVVAMIRWTRGGWFKRIFLMWRCNRSFLASLCGHGGTSMVLADRLISAPKNNVLKYSGLTQQHGSEAKWTIVRHESKDDWA